MLSLGTVALVGIILAIIAIIVLSLNTLISNGLRTTKALVVPGGTASTVGGYLFWPNLILLILVFAFLIFCIWIAVASRGKSVGTTQVTTVPAKAGISV